MKGSTKLYLSFAIAFAIWLTVKYIIPNWEVIFTTENFVFYNFFTTAVAVFITTEGIVEENPKAAFLYFLCPITYPTIIIGGIVFLFIEGVKKITFYSDKYL